MEPESEVRSQVDPTKEDHWPLSAVIIFAATGSMEAVAATWPKLSSYGQVEIGENSGTLRTIHLVSGGIKHHHEVDLGRRKVWGKLAAGEMRAKGIARHQAHPSDIPVDEWRHLMPFDYEAGSSAVGVSVGGSDDIDSDCADPMLPDVELVYANVWIKKSEIMTAFGAEDGATAACPPTGKRRRPEKRFGPRAMKSSRRDLHAIKELIDTADDPVRPTANAAVVEHVAIAYRDFPAPESKITDLGKKYRQWEDDGFPPI